MANELDAFVPQLWANESILILVENMVAANLVYRDFEPYVAKYGDVVNTRRPSEFSAIRKQVIDEVTDQDAVATNVAVPLNQLVHTSFVIHDGEESKSFKNLVDEYLKPAMIAQARFIDQIVLGQYPQFLGTVAGGLNQMSPSNAFQYMLNTRSALTRNKAYMEGRNLIWTPTCEADVMQSGVNGQGSLFLSAYSVGDDGTALREAHLGRKLGFDNYLCQNMASVAVGNTVVTGTVNQSGGYSANTKTMTVAGFSGALTSGSYFTVAGDNTPQRITAHTETTGATTSITFSPGLVNPVANSAAITVYSPGAVNQSVSPSGFQAGWYGDISVDGFTVAPQVGQMVSFGTDSPVYTIINGYGTPTTTAITLDRPLDMAIADNATVNIGPAGNYNLSFHRNALALVVRPLVLPRPGTGAIGAVVNDRGLSLRVVITYDGKAQGLRVTLDMLCGIAILDTRLGAVMLG